MKASIVTCTRDRAASLRRMLQSLSEMDPVDEPWELVVVDNGSSDDTDAVIRSFNGILPIRGVREDRPGVSRARNAGIAAARGEYFIWTDDDVVVDRGFLAAYLRAFARWPEVAAFGGKAIPVFEEPAHRWMVDNRDLLRDLLAWRDFGDDPVPFGGDADVIPFGLNYAIRATEQRLFPYDPALGVGPGNRVGGEETIVLSAIQAAGYPTLWIPDALVHHMIPPHRQTVDYVRTYYEARGISLAGHKDTDRSPCWFGVPRWRWKRLFLSGIAYRFGRGGSARKWLPRLIDYSVQKGWIGERLARRRATAGG